MISSARVILRRSTRQRTEKPRKLAGRITNPVVALRRFHSITTSARARDVGGTSRPSIVAVCVHHQFELTRLYNGKVRWFGRFQHSPNINKA